MKGTGYILIIIGVLLMMYSGFIYFTNDRVADIGPVHINKEREHVISWPPLIGAILVFAGLFALISRKKA
jgi:hypothetical protein